jgi:hypothetical protein
VKRATAVAAALAATLFINIKTSNDQAQQNLMA